MEGGDSYNCFWRVAVRRPIHVHDLHATMLHALGLDHEKLTYRYQAGISG